MTTIDDGDLFDPALDRVDEIMYGGEPDEPDWGSPDWGYQPEDNGYGRVRVGHSCYWGWVDRPGGGQRRCRVCNLRPRVLRRHEGRRIRRYGPFDTEAPF